METFNLGDSIAQLKVLKWQHEDSITPEEREELTQRILELIDKIEIPELIGTEAQKL